MKTKSNWLASGLSKLHLLPTNPTAFFLTTAMVFANAAALSGQCSGLLVGPFKGTFCAAEEVTLMVEVIQGVAPFQVSWSTNPNGVIISTNGLEATVLGNQGSSYTATVTDDNGCVFTAFFSTAPQNFTPFITITDANCPPEPSTLTANVNGAGLYGPYTYNWSTGESTQSIQALPPGSYSVTATSALGCTKVAQASPALPFLIEPTITGPQGLCDGIAGILTVTAPTPSGINSYTWSTGLVTDSNQLPIVGPGIYTVTVTNLATPCTGIASINVQQLTPTVPQPIVGGGGICPGETTTVGLVNANSYAIIDWSTNATTPSITVSSPGTYFVTVTEANACTAFAGIQVDEFVITDPNILGKPDICVGQETVTLSITPSFSQYDWSTGENTPTITINDDGSYGVTVTDANGCVTENATLIPPAFIPSPNVETGPVPCPGGIVTLLETTGPFISYLWSNGGTSFSNPVSTAGTYSVTVTNSSNCTGTAMAEVVYSTNPAPSITATSGNCGSITFLSASAGEFYSWSTGDNTQAITVATPGTYTVTVTNTEGCIGTASAVVTPTSGNAAVAASGPPSFCASSAAILTASQGFTSYAWSNGTTGISTQVTATGTYTVTATDATGCTSQAAVTTTASPLPSPTISGPSGICPGGSASLQLNGNFTSIAWSTGANTPSITVGNSGTYIATVTNAAGCTASASVVVEASPLPTASISGPTSICQGSSPELGVSGSFASINWSTNANTPSITVNTAGNYSVTVTNAAGCSATSQLALQVGGSLTPQVTVNNNGCNGSASISVNGNFASYAWSNGATLSSIVANAEGNYTVTVSDGSNCTGTASALVDFPTLPQASILGPNSACEGQTANWSATNGFASYTWIGPSGAVVGNTESITIAQPGPYTLTVADDNGCTATTQQVFASLPSPSVDINGPNSICTGSLAAFVANGDYAQATWSNGFVGPNIIATLPGTYSVTVSNTNGCSATSAVTLSVGASLLPSITLDAVGCNSATMLTAGSGYANYLWSNGAMTQTTSTFAPGSFTVTVTDASGCTGTASALVSLPSQLQVAIAGPAAVCEGGTVTLVGTSGFANYAWATPQGNLATPSIQATQPGNYTLTVTDDNGCTAIAQQSIIFQAPPSVGISGPSSICIGSTTEYAVVGSFALVQWNTGAFATSITVGQSGTYSVTVADGNGCTATASQVLTTGSSLAISIEQSPNCTNGTSILSAGTGYDSYLWSNGATTPSIAVTDQVLYSVTVSDAGNCTGEAQLAAGLPQLPTVAIVGNTTVCTGGTTTLGLTSNFPQVLWSTGATSSSVSISTPGNYAVTVTDANGCTALANALLTLAPPLPLTIASNLAPCQVSATLSAGTGFASYLWSNGAATQSIQAVQSGNYAVTVSNADGCTGQASLAVNLPSLPQVSIQGNGAVCEGYSTSLNASAIFNSYLWSTGETSPGITVSTAGTFGLTVTDANGCTATNNWLVSLLSTVNTNLQVQSCSAQDTGSVVSIFAGLNGCDSIVTISTVYVPTITESVSLAACEGSSASYGGVAIPAGDTQTFSYVSWEGCDSLVVVSVEVLPVPAFTAQVGESCWNKGDGSLMVAVQTGTPPYFFALEGGALQSKPMFEGLSDGSYTVLVQDGNGCELESLVEVPTRERTLVSVNDQVLRCADDSLTIVPEVVSGDADRLEWQWTDGSTTPTLVVSAIGNYGVTVSDGCEEQNFTVNVRPSLEATEDSYFYVPNAFSPNGDQTNDLLKAFVGQGVEVQSFEFRVFDRWGEQMFFTEDPSDGWDGLLREEHLKSEVVVWYLKATVANCKGDDMDLFRKGDVVIVR
ncbi:MAG: gliding motility-associated C-terminal domain-containing protein [Saprospiraceae bacterium]|nr:gliding motility-associated C-terminal domain-containing protein [Saprospiraceae bacterium]